MCVSKDKKLCGCFSIEFGVFIAFCLQFFSTLLTLFFGLWVHAGMSTGLCFLLAGMSKLGVSMCYRKTIMYLYMLSLIFTIALIITMPILRIKVYEEPENECEDIENYDQDADEIIIDGIIYDDVD